MNSKEHWRGREVKRRQGRHEEGREGVNEGKRGYFSAPLGVCECCKKTHLEIIRI